MKKRVVHKVLLVFFILVSISFLAFLSSSWYINKHVRLRLQEELAAQTNGQYMLRIETLRLNLLSQSVKFKGVALKPDKINANDALYNASASEVNFLGLEVLRFIFSKKIMIDRVELVDPKISIIQSSVYSPGNDDTTTKFSLYSYVSKFAKSLTFRTLDVSNFDLSLFNKVSDLKPSLNSTENHFRIINFYVGTSTKDLSSMFDADTIALDLHRFNYTTNDSLYTFEVKRMRVSYADSTLKIDSIKVIPNFSKKWFAYVAGKQTDRFDIDAKEVYFKKIDLRHFFERHGIISKSLDINYFSLSSFRNKNDERLFSRPKSLQSILRESEMYIRIDTINISNSAVVIEEIAPGKKATGRITFDDINGKFTGLMNDSLLINDKSKMLFTATCKVMNKTPLYAEYAFPLNASGMVFNCKGFLTGMEMKSLNAMLEPATGVSIKSGIIDTLDFHFTAGENRSSGKMKFIYHDLKVQMPESEENEVKGISGLTLLIANNFIIKESNPNGKKPARLSSIEFVRNKERFMFHYTWKSILSGLKETIGIPDKK